jgi:hypothetical protein
MRFPCSARSARLLARPSFARAVEEARPFRPLFPLGSPDKDRSPALQTPDGAFGDDCCRRDNAALARSG